MVLTILDEKALSFTKRVEITFAYLRFLNMIQLKSLQVNHGVCFYWVSEQDTGPYFDIKDVFPGIAIPIIKIR